MNRQFYRAASSLILTEAALRAMGAPVDNPELMAMSGFYPLEYQTVEYDPMLETVQAVGELQFDGAKYVQSMQKVDLPIEQQEASVKQYAENLAVVARKAADSAVSSYLTAYSDIEKLTFPQQRLEVEAHQKNNGVATPVLDSLAEQRGVPREEQIAKAAEKVAYFDLLTKTVVGKQQEYEDKIKAAAENGEKTPRERLAVLRAMQFDYTVPAAV